MEEPANSAKRPKTPEEQPIRPQLKPLRPLDYMGTKAPKAAFKPSEKPLVELPVLGGNSGPPRLPSDLMLLDSPTIETRSQPLISPGIIHKDDLDSLLRDIEAA